MNTVRLNGLLIDNRCFGKTMLLNRVTPYYLYVNDQKTDTVAGYKYTVILPSKGYQSLDVKIESDAPLVRIPADADSVPVEFSGLEVKLYYDFNRRVQMSAKASGVKVAS